MNNDFDDFDGIINDLKVKRKRQNFKLIELKLEHYHWNSGDVEISMPISTSIELTSEYDLEFEKLKWKKTITHSYIDFENINKKNINKREEEFNEINVINELEKYDLRELKNNYFTETSPEAFCHWELTYNNYFKISGTYDREVEEVKRISELLNFKNIIKNEIEKIQDDLKKLK